MLLSRLPLELTSFVGRAEELDRLAELLGTARLVTLTGGPGAGKTRLARECLVARVAPLRDVAWVELAGLRDPDHLPREIADALGAGREAQPADAEALARLIGDRALVLALDNCEHLVDAVAAVVETLLHRCPDVSILATSREALRIAGEHAWLVPPLGLPESRDGVGNVRAPECAESVQLFVARAREVRPDFPVEGESADAVVEICRRLDGIPLAIELAAARTRALSAQEVLRRLDDLFRILTDDRRGALPRHRTLRAAIDWSHELLSEEGRELFRRLAVFRGGFTLEGAEAVGVGGRVAEADVLDVLGRLVGQSLVGVRERTGYARYHLLEAVRQYAHERLVEADEDEETRRGHAAHVVALVEAASPHLTARDRRHWIDRLREELDNVRSALEWTVERDPDLHLRLVASLWWFWFSTQHWAEAERWIEGALQLPVASRNDAVRAHLLFARGALASLQVRPEVARPALEEAVDLARSLGEARLEAYAENYLGLGYAGEGRPEAAELCSRAETWFRREGDLYGLRLSLLLQGSAAMGAGRLDEAERLNREGVAVAREFGQPRELAISLQNLAAVLIAGERLDEAERLIREALGLSRQDVSHYFVATGVAYLAEVRGRQGRDAEAARLFGAADGLRSRVGARAFPLDARRQQTVVDGVRERLGDAAFVQAWEQGRSTGVEALLSEVAGEAGPRPRAVDARSDVPATGSTVDLDVRVLGPLRVEVDGVPVEDDRWPYSKPRELLVHLLLHPEGRSRDQIGEALWPDAPAANVKNSFHVTLHHLRKALGHPEWVGVEGDRYRLDRAVRVRLDAARFEAEARDALATTDHDPDRIRRALDLYGGPLLEGEAPGRWADAPRDRLHRLQIDLRLALGDHLEATDPRAAAELYRTLALREELDEEVHRRYMRSLEETGDRVGALRHYERLVALLDASLDAEPEPETRDLYDRLRATG